MAIRLWKGGLLPQASVSIKVQISFHHVVDCIAEAIAHSRTVLKKRDIEKAIKDFLPIVLKTEESVHPEEFYKAANLLLLSIWPEWFPDEHPR